MVNPRQCLRVSAAQLAEETATFYKIGHHGTMIDEKLFAMLLLKIELGTHQ